MRRKSVDGSRIDIPEPNEKEVNRYLGSWKDEDKKIDDALGRLFRNYLPYNSDIGEVMTKCAALNDIYGTNIRNIRSIADHIVHLNIDRRLEISDVQLVTDIATGHGVETKPKRGEGKEYCFFSFATKYCSFHRPDDYPIYDSYIAKLLEYFRDKNGFCEFKKKDLRDYPRFKEIVLAFREKYSLSSFSVRDIDKYLWLLGKEQMPLPYHKKKD
jgi:hypothetical protein